MKLYVDNTCVCELDERQLKVLAHDIGYQQLRSDIERRVRWIIQHKHDQTKKRLINEWFPTLQERYDSLPAKEDALVDLIFEQPDYDVSQFWYLDNQSDDDRSPSKQDQASS